MIRLSFWSLALAVLAAGAAAGQEDGFKPLFDGKSLDGWTQHGGKAKYSVEDGAVVGRSVPNTANSFLCTNKEFGDFILELEFKVDPRLNSGVQIRSQVFEAAKEIDVEGKKRNIPADRVHGYQVEIDPSDRSFSGAIYDEARRGRFLADLKDNEAARKAFKQGEWNKFRIECKGDAIRTWINGVPAVDLKDGMTPKGVIALQVHGVGMREEPMEVRWRNIRIKEL
jgi:3-keto-disaccharide hydrolase